MANETLERPLELGLGVFVNMQTVSQRYYRDRTVFYASRLINGMGVKGKDWNYKLSPVYVVNILGYELDRRFELPEDEYVIFADFRFRNTNIIFYDKLVLAYIGLKRFKKELHEVKTTIEQWLFYCRICIN